MIGVEGIFRLRSINPDGSVAHDTGDIHNVVTKNGLQLMLIGLTTDGDFTLGGDGDAGFDSTNYVEYIGVGEGISRSIEQYYDADGLESEVTDSPYIRQAVNQTDYETDLIISAAYDAAVPDASRIVFRASFPAGQFDQIDVSEVGLFDAQTVGYLIAGQKFTSFQVLSTQILDVTYTIYLVQEAPA